MIKDKISRGDIYWVDLPKIDAKSHIQSSRRPCIIISNNVCNVVSNVLSIVPLTSVTKKLRGQITHAIIYDDILNKPSMIIGEQILSVDKLRIKNYIGHCSEISMCKVNKVIAAQLQLAI